MLFEKKKDFKDLKKITGVQKRRLELFADGLSAREVARIEKVNPKSIFETKKQIKAKAIVFYGRMGINENADKEKIITLKNQA